jgi:hypothetical protein
MRAQTKLDHEAKPKARGTDDAGTSTRDDDTGAVAARWFEHDIAKRSRDDDEAFRVREQAT